VVQPSSRRGKQLATSMFGIGFGNRQCVPSSPGLTCLAARSGVHKSSAPSTASKSLPTSAPRAPVPPAAGAWGRRRVDAGGAGAGGGYQITLNCGPDQQYSVPPQLTWLGKCRQMSVHQSTLPLWWRWALPKDIRSAGRGRFCRDAGFRISNRGTLPSSASWSLRGQAGSRKCACNGTDRPSRSGVRPGCPCNCPTTARTSRGARSTSSQRRATTIARLVCVALARRCVLVCCRVPLVRRGFVKVVAVVPLVNRKATWVPVIVLPTVA
jgi:hypothetical protein